MISQKQYKRIFITGAYGMVGRELSSIFPQAYRISSKDCDLRDQKDTQNFLRYENPDIVFHVAARVGGVKDNLDRIYEYYYDNLMMNTNIINYCVNTNTRFIGISSTCVYPSLPPAFPMTEDMVLSSEPDSGNYGYAYAKRMMNVQLLSAKQQFGYSDWLVLYSSNLYGSLYDNWDLSSSHVIPALVRKFREAKDLGRPTVEVWGDGSPLRQFTHVSDFAQLVRLTGAKDPLCGFFNCLNPTQYSIRSIVEMIAEVTEYEGEIVWTKNYQGIQNKEVSNQLLRSYLKRHNFEFTPIRKGLETLVKEYQLHGQTH